MAYNQKGFPVHVTGQISKAPVKKMSEKGKATTMGALGGAAKGAMACVAAGPWAAAVCGLVGGVIGGVSGSRKFQKEQGIIAEQKRIQDIATAEEKTAKQREEEMAQVATDNRTTRRLPGRVERINPDGTVTEQTEVRTSSSSLDRLYSPFSKKGNMKPIKKLKAVDMPSGILKMPASQGNDIDRFNDIAMNIDDEPTGADLPFIEDPLIDSPLMQTEKEEEQIKSSTKERRYYDFDIAKPIPTKYKNIPFVDDSLVDAKVVTAKMNIPHQRIIKK